MMALQPCNEYGAYRGVYVNCDELDLALYVLTFLKISPVKHPEASQSSFLLHVIFPKARQVTPNAHLI